MPSSQKKATAAPAQPTTVQSGQASRPHRRRQAYDQGLGPASTPSPSTSSSEKSSTRSRRHGTKSTSTITTTTTHRSASSTTYTTALTQATSMADEAADYLQPIHDPNVNAASYWQACPYSPCSDASCWTHASLVAQQGYYLTGVGGRFTDTSDTHLGYTEVLVDEETEVAWYAANTRS